MDFDEWFKDELASRGLSDQGFVNAAKHLGYTLSKSGVRAWRVGSSTPGTTNCRLIAAVFKVPEESVLARAGHGGRDIEELERPKGLDELLYGFPRLDRRGQRSVIALLRQELASLDEEAEEMVENQGSRGGQVLGEQTRA